MDVGHLVVQACQQVGELARLDDSLQSLDRVPFSEVEQNLCFVVHVRIAEREPDEKTVELRFGQGKGPFVLDRVLRGQHEEWKG